MGKLQGDRVRENNGGETIKSLEAKIEKLKKQSFKMIKTNFIHFREPFISAFKIKKETKAEITENMSSFGFDRTEPVLLVEDGKDSFICIDGHTRTTVAKELEIDEIPAIITNFNSDDEALNYIYHRQFHRRNLSDNDLLECVKVFIPVQGQGKTKEQFAKFCCIGATKAGRIISVQNHKNEYEEIYNKVLAGELSAHTAYDLIQANKKNVKLEKKIEAEKEAENKQGVYIRDENELGLTETEIDVVSNKDTDLANDNIKRQMKTAKYSSKQKDKSVKKPSDSLETFAKKTVEFVKLQNVQTAHDIKTNTIAYLTNIMQLGYLKKNDYDFLSKKISNCKI